MKIKIYFTIFITLLTVMISCSSQEEKKKIKDLQKQVENLITENRELRENLKKYENKEAKELEVEKKRLEKLRKTSQGLILNDKVQVITVKTGYDPYHNYSNLWLPTITLMFKNISNNNIKDFIKVRAIFIDNSTGEQIAEDFEYLITDSRPFLTDTKKQITLQSSVGWRAVQNQNVSVKISIEDEPFKTYKIKNREYDGRI